MTVALILGIAFALICALVNNVAFLLKHDGVQQAASVTWNRPWSSSRDLFRETRFTFGMIAAAIAFAFHVAAMALAPLSVVKPVIAGGLVFLAIAAEAWFGHKIDRRQRIGVAAAAFGLILLALTTPISHSSGHVAVERMMVFEAAMISGAAFVAFLATRIRREVASGRLLGIVTGLLFGASDVAIKALTDMQISEVITSPWIAFCLGCAIVAFLVGARALQLGDAVATIALTCLASNITTIIGGFTVFGDPIPGDWVTRMIYLSGIVFVIGAAALIPDPRNRSR